MKSGTSISQKKLLNWHSWAGIVAGLGLLLLSVTGSVLCFKEELKPLVHPELYTEKVQPALTLHKFYVELNNQFGDWYVVRFYLPEDPEEAYTAYLQHRSESNRHKTVYLTKSGWKVLQNSWLYYAEELHYYMLLPRYPGLVVNFILSISLLVLTITGFVIYKKPILKILTFKSGLKFNSAKGWHTSTGMIVLLFITVMATTSTIITFSGVIGGPRASSIFQLSVPKNFNVDFLSKEAEKNKTIPTATLKYVSFLNGKTMFHYEIAGNRTIDEFCRIFLDPTNGKLLSVAGKTDNRLLRALNSCVPFHFGNFGGIALKIAYSIGAVLLSLLTITGSLIYFKRGKRKEENSKTKKPFVPAKFKVTISRTFKYGSSILIVFTVTGFMYGIFIGDPLKGSVYLITILLFPVLLNALVLILFYPFYLLIVWLRKRKRNPVLVEYSSYSLCFFLIALVWYTAVFMCKF